MPNAFGASQTPNQQVPSDSRIVSLFKALIGHGSQTAPQPVDPYANFAAKATGQPHQ